MEKFNTLIQFSVGLFLYLSISIVQTSPVNFHDGFDYLDLIDNSEYSVMPANSTCLSPSHRNYIARLHQIVANKLLNFEEQTMDNHQEGVTRKCAIDGPCGILRMKRLEPLPEDDEDDPGPFKDAEEMDSRCICQKPQGTCSNGPLTNLEDGSEGFIFYCRNRNCGSHRMWLKKRWGDLKKNSLIHNFTQV